jgi:hypothetical protein
MNFISSQNMKNIRPLIKENSDYNQYWYSDNTVNTILMELELVKPVRVACVSTPSVFFAAVEAGIPCDLFEFDTCIGNHSWAGKGSNKFVQYDFRSTHMDQLYWGAYDVVVADPPFITSDVIECYARHIKQLLMPGGKVIFSSTAENGPNLKASFLLDFRPVRFKPSIPNLVYQYELFVNYIPHDNSVLRISNPEVP